MCIEVRVEVARDPTETHQHSVTAADIPSDPSRYHTLCLHPVRHAQDITSITIPFRHDRLSTASASSIMS